MTKEDITKKIQLYNEAYAELLEVFRELHTLGKKLCEFRKENGDGYQNLPDFKDFNITNDDMYMNGGDNTVSIRNNKFVVFKWFGYDRCGDSESDEFAFPLSYLWEDWVALESIAIMEKREKSRKEKEERDRLTQENQRKKDIEAYENLKAKLGL